jgi:hypothetical protein
MLVAVELGGRSRSQARPMPTRSIAVSAFAVSAVTPGQRVAPPPYQQYIPITLSLPSVGALHAPSPIEPAPEAASRPAVALGCRRRNRTDEPDHEPTRTNPTERGQNEPGGPGAFKKCTHEPDGPLAPGACKTNPRPEPQPKNAERTRETLEKQRPEPRSSHLTGTGYCRSVLGLLPVDPGPIRRATDRRRPPAIQGRSLHSEKDIPFCKPC